METTIAAGVFKAQCLRLLDEVERSRKDIIITKRGRPVARLMPVQQGAANIIGRLHGTIEICGDIVGPGAETWDADA